MLRIVGVFICIALPLAGQIKRALIVGIDQYQTRPVAAAKTSTEAISDSASRRQTGKAARIPAKGKARGAWQNLNGAVADATSYRQILIDRYGFAPENIVSLSDKKHSMTLAEVATAQRILDTIQTHLIDAAKPGDISVFVYAGHGSRMLNTGSDEADHMDQTLVPADSEDGTPDIRDKELARLFRKAADKRVLLTVISDSCHSGGISRGLGAPVVTRNVPADPHEVNDPTDIDPKSLKPYPDPAESGYVLVISSARDDQPAEEMDAQGNQRGVFSYFFQQSLRVAPPNESIDQVFSRTAALMRASGRMQVPQIEGKGRRQSTLLGTKAVSKSGISAVVQAVDDRSITLRGGLSLGLQQGCELVRNGEKNGTRIRISAPPTISSAVATVISGTLPQVGDYFVLDLWTVPQDIETRFFLPSKNLPTKGELRIVATAIREAAPTRNWVVDPIAETSAAIIRYDSGSWEIEERNQSKLSRRSLGKSPSASSWSEALSKVQPGKIFVDFPPAKDFFDSLKSAVESGVDAVHYVEARSQALYQLVGRVGDQSAGSELEYCWILANTNAEDEGKTPLPIRTDWFKAADPEAAAQLYQRALNIARLRLWLQISVPGGGENPYPYSLSLRNKSTGETKTDGQLIEGELYDLMLTSATERLQAAAESSKSQWVYVAAIDQNGRMNPIFPRQLINTSANHLPRDGSPLALTLRTIGPVGKPYGTDTLILIASEEEIDPVALQIDAVRTRGESRSGAKGSVNRLLFQMKAGARGVADGAPSNWSIQRLTFRSVEKSKLNQEKK